MEIILKIFQIIWECINEKTIISGLIVAFVIEAVATIIKTTNPSSSKKQQSSSSASRMKQSAHGVIITALIVLICFTILGCEGNSSVLGPPSQFGPGAVAILFIAVSILTIIAGIIGFILSLIPIIGIFFRYLIIIAIILFWIGFLYYVIYHNGLFHAAFEIIVMLFVAGSVGGGTIFILIIT